MAMQMNQIIIFQPMLISIRDRSHYWPKYAHPTSFWLSVSHFQMKKNGTTTAQQNESIVLISIHTWDAFQRKIENDHAQP